MPSGNAYDVLIRAYADIVNEYEHLLTIPDINEYYSNKAVKDMGINLIRESDEKIIKSLFEERDGGEYLNAFFDPEMVHNARSNDDEQTDHGKKKISKLYIGASSDDGK